MNESYYQNEIRSYVHQIINKNLVSDLVIFIFHEKKKVLKSLVWYF